MSITDHCAFMNESDLPQGLVGALARRSQSEVSRWLSNPEQVSAACRKAIEIAIERLAVVIEAASGLPPYLKLDFQNPDAICQLLDDLEQPGFVSYFRQQVLANIPAQATA
jgi:hypothetical protein